MTRKSFKTSFDSLLGEEPVQKPQHDLEKEIKATFVVKVKHIDKLKAVAYWERKLIKNILDEALINYITAYEKEKGAIQLPK